MDIADLLLLFFNRFESFSSILKTIGYIFLIGFAVFIILYFKRLKDNITSWKEMDSFDKIIFILLIGLILIIPIIFFSLFFFFVGMIIYEFTTPYICGQMMDYFGKIFFGLIFIYLIYILFKFEIKKIDSKILINLFLFWKPLKYLWWIDLILFVLVLVFGAVTNCIGFG